MRGRAWRRALASCFALMVVSGFLPVQPVNDIFVGFSAAVCAEDIVTKPCGQAAFFQFDKQTGVLTVYGTGDMDNLSSSGLMPWYNYKNKIISVEILNGITSIGTFSFLGCNKLASVDIAESVTRIESKVFKNCTGLTSVSIPSGVVYIGGDAFYGCTGITDVYCYADPKSLTWDEDSCNDFKKDGSTVCHVPAEYLDDYNTYFGADSESPVNVTFVGDIGVTGLGEHLDGYSLSLDGDIGVNFYMELADDVAASETAYMQFTIPAGSKTETKTVLVKDAIKKDMNGKTYHVFKCNVSAKDMASTIKAQIKADKSGTEYEYSVKDYADYLLLHTDDDETYANAAPLVKKLLNYGAASQTYFGIAGTAVNAGLSEAERVIDNVKIPEKFKYNEANTHLPTGVTLTGVTLSLKSETTLSLYFTGLPDNTVFTCEGKDNVESVKNGSYMVARIRGIKAKELENDFTVTFNGNSNSVTYNPMTYCYNVLSSNTDENLQNVCKALYQYAEAAKVYSE